MSELLSHVACVDIDGVCLHTLQPIYAHVTKEHLQWFTNNEVDILNDLSQVLCDHITLLQHCYHQQHESSSSNTEELHEMHGGSISISYAIRPNSKQYDHTLRYASVDAHAVPEAMSLASFSLNPLYVRPTSSSSLST